MWGFPYLTWLSIAGMLGILIAMAFIPDQRKPLWLGVASLGLLLVAYRVFVHRRGRARCVDEHELASYPPR
jgi:GABA permease